MIGIAQAFKLACQITSVIILSRLLAPQAFGIVAMAAPVLSFVGLFQDLGLSHAIVQKKSIGHEEVSCLFWINLVVSVLLAGLLVLVAPLVAAFYGELRVGVLVAAMGLQIVIYGLATQHNAILNRRMEFNRIAIIETVSALAGLVAAIAWAMVDRSYWALYAGGIASAALYAIGVWASSHWRPGRPRWVTGAGSLVNFGAGITGFQFANFFARNLDNILIGRYWGGRELGLYDRAYKLLLFPLQQITNPLTKVMVPALSRLTGEPERYRSAYLRVIPLLLLVALPGVAFAIATADLVIPFVLGEQWRESAGIFRALGFAGLLQPLNNPAGWLFISQGRSGDFMRWGIITAVTSVLAFFIGLPYGALGVAVAYAVSEYLRTPFLWMYIGKRGPLRASDMLRAATPFVLGAHVAIAAIWLVRPYRPDSDLVTICGAAILSYGVVSAIALLFRSGREAMAEGLKLLQRGIVTSG